MNKDTLKPANQGEIQFVAEIAPRYNDTVDTHKRVFGEYPKLSKDMGKSVETFHRVFNRFNSQKDFRITRSEYEALQSVAQWCVDTYRRCRGQSSETVVWRGRSMS